MRGNEPQPGAVPEGSGSIPGTSEEIDEVMDGGADGSDTELPAEGDEDAR